MFFQCITALLDPANRRREGTKWGLIIYTVLMFSFVTICTGMGLNLISISFVDNRGFPGVGDRLPPGPVGYWFFAGSNVTQCCILLEQLVSRWPFSKFSPSLFIHPEVSRRLLF